MALKKSTKTNLHYVFEILFYQSNHLNAQESPFFLHTFFKSFC